MNILSILAEDRNLIPYRKSLRGITGSVTGTILFSQLLYWFEKTNWQPFYKFVQPCPNNPNYNIGDSWCEELGFSYEEFTNAFARLGAKYKTKTDFKEADLSGLMFWAYTDKISGLTYWCANRAEIQSKILALIQNTELDKVELRNSGKSKHVIRESRITCLEKVEFDITKTTTVDYTENNNNSVFSKKEKIAKPKLDFIEIKDSVTIPFNIKMYGQAANEKATFDEGALIDYAAQIEKNKLIHSAALKKPKKEPLDFSTHEFKYFDNPEEMVEIWKNWTTYKHKEKGFVYKVHSSQNIAISKLCEFAKNKSAIAKQIIENSIAGGYDGFFALKASYQQPTKPSGRAEIIDPNKYK